MNTKNFCYRCLYPEPPPPGLVPSCAEGGVLGILPGVEGLIQATEAIKLLLGIGETLVGRLLLYDALAMRFREMRVRKDPDCPVCGTHPTITRLVDAEQICAAPAADAPEDDFAVTPRGLDRMRRSGENHLLLDVRTPDEWEICRSEGSKLVPLPLLDRSTGELDPAQTIVVVCHRGFRSAYAVDYLRSRGFARARNLAGGIDAWAAEVDPSVPRY